MFFMLFNLQKFKISLEIKKINFPRGCRLIGSQIKHHTNCLFFYMYFIIDFPPTSCRVQEMKEVKSLIPY